MKGNIFCEYERLENFLGDSLAATPQAGNTEFFSPEEFLVLYNGAVRQIRNLERDVRLYKGIAGAYAEAYGDTTL